MSNRQRDRLNKLVRRKLIEIGGDEIDIKRDSLHHRYEVNKFGIDVDAPLTTLLDVYDRLLALLTVEGWTLQREGSTLVLRHHSADATSAVLSRPYLLPWSSKDARLHIAISLSGTWPGYPAQREPAARTRR